MLLSILARALFALVCLLTTGIICLLVSGLLSNAGVSNAVASAAGDPQGWYGSSDLTGLLYHFTLLSF
jgi:hypothetical protein